MKYIIKNGTITLTDSGCMDSAALILNYKRDVIDKLKPGYQNGVAIHHNDCDTICYIYRNKESIVFLFMTEAKNEG